jgi:hypothetical protein
VLTGFEKALKIDHSKQKLLCKKIAQAVFVLIDIDRLTSVERHTAVL